MDDTTTIIGGIAKGKGEEILVSRSTFRGCEYVDVRVHYLARSDDKRLPTKKGVTIRADNLAKLIELLQQAGNAA